MRRLTLPFTLAGLSGESSALLPLAVDETTRTGTLSLSASSEVGCTSVQAHNCRSSSKPAGLSEPSSFVRPAFKDELLERLEEVEHSTPVLRGWLLAVLATIRSPTCHVSPPVSSPNFETDLSVNVAPTAGRSTAFLTRHARTEATHSFGVVLELQIDRTRRQRRFYPRADGRLAGKALHRLPPPHGGCEKGKK